MLYLDNILISNLRGVKFKLHTAGVLRRETILVVFGVSVAINTCTLLNYYMIMLDIQVKSTVKPRFK